MTQPTNLRTSRWALLALLLAGCAADPTYVLTRFERGAQLTGDVARLELTLLLDGVSDTATIDGRGAALQLPFTRALQIVNGEGTLAVTARALDTQGTELGAASEQVTIEPRQIAGLTLVLGAESVKADLGADLNVPDLGAADDLAIALDLPQALAAPVLVVSAPPEPLYEMDTYVWTITATQSGATLPPVLSFDPTTLAPGMIPLSTGPGGATLTFAPTFRQAGAYAVTVIATSTAQTGSETSQAIAITIVNTVDPIGNFHDAEDAAWFGPTTVPTPSSLPVFSVGDFNGDGFDDLVHVVRNRRLIGTDLSQGYQSALRFYVVLGSALGLPVPPDDASAAVPASSQIRRIAHTEDELASVNSQGLELFPPLYDYQDQYLAGARLFPASSADKGREIVFLDRNYRYDASNRFFRSQLFVVPSNATATSTVVPLLDTDALPRTDNGATLVAGDFEGDGVDELIYDATISDTGVDRRLALWRNDSETEPTALAPTTLAAFAVCPNSAQPQYLGFGNVLAAAGNELAISACTTSLGANAISVLDTMGFAQSMLLPPKAADTSNGPYTPFGLCDLDDDGFDDLYRLDTRTGPTAIEVYLNTKTSPPYPVVAASGALDEKQVRRLELGATTVGSWQYVGCLRHKSGDRLWVARGFNYEDTRYEVVPIVLGSGAATLTKGTPFQSGFMTWPGENTSRPWFNRPKGSGDFNGDGKLDVVTAASGQTGRSYWNVVYGR